MFTRMFIVMIALLAVLSACAPAGGTDVLEVGIEPATETNSNQAIKDELQPIMEAMYSETLEGTLALMQFIEVPCANVDGLGGPPPCPEGVAEGTALEVFPTLSSHGSLVSREEATNLLVNLQVKTCMRSTARNPIPMLSRTTSPVSMPCSSSGT